jgi:hypothetical protein
LLCNVPSLSAGALRCGVQCSCIVAGLLRGHGGRDEHIRTTAHSMTSWKFHSNSIGIFPVSQFPERGVASV